MPRKKSARAKKAPSENTGQPTPPTTNTPAASSQRITRSAAPRANATAVAPPTNPAPKGASIKKRTKQTRSVHKEAEPPNPEDDLEEAGSDQDTQNPTPPGCSSANGLSAGGLSQGDVGGSSGSAPVPKPDAAPGGISESQHAISGNVARDRQLNSTMQLVWTYNSRTGELHYANPEEPGSGPHYGSSSGSSMSGSDAGTESASGSHIVEVWPAHGSDTLPSPIPSPSQFPHPSPKPLALQYLSFQPSPLDAPSSRHPSPSHSSLPLPPLKRKSISTLTSKEKKKARNASRPTLSEFSELGRDATKATNLAASYFRVLIATEISPFLAPGEEKNKCASRAWALALQDLGLSNDAVPFNPRISAYIGECASKARSAVKDAAQYAVLQYGFQSPVSASPKDLEASKIANVDLVKRLKTDYAFLFRNTQSEGLLEHPVIFQVILDTWFGKGKDSLGILFPQFFCPIRPHTVALAIAAILHCINDWKSGVNGGTPFTAKDSKNEAAFKSALLLIDEFTTFSDRTRVAVPKLLMNFYERGRLHAQPPKYIGSGIQRLSDEMLASAAASCSFTDK